MFDDFPFETVAELQARGILRVEDGNHGNDRPRPEEFGSGNTAFIRAADMNGGRVLFESADKINDVALARIRKGKGKPGDILFSSKGTVGKLAIVQMDAPPFVCSPQTTYWRTLDENKLNRSFLYAFMQSSWFTDQWEAIKGDTDMADYASLTSQRQFRVPLPDIKFQRTVASVFRPLDDKIELNRRMNRTLEELAAALFRSWFVDFDPVVAKAAGRTPAHLRPDLAALFPASWQDSELGEIPKRWNVTPVSEICENIFSGGTPHTQTPEYWNGDLPWLSSGETRETFIISTEKAITQSGVKNSSTRLAKSGSTVIAGAGQGHTRGQTSLLLLDSYINQSVVVLAADRKIASDLFLFFDLARRYEEFRQLSDAHSSRGSLTTKLLGGIKTVLPSFELVTKFEEVVGPMVAQISANLRESRTLAALRDTLLPKLLSGELRVKAAMRKLETSA